ncbi:Holliday junction branch migration protein RuvA [Prochlorococcus sp. MIT 1223]|uniref:Holliday junction branch migration protein RuvA n=1 Tax=Prochlorococcus sp. MIT 1223 TaxID=3096217 RepID=UPI002A763CA9|nr:Holliday junction branch migration protein RuvA [Prochlorococcus sp. MIT 1223]
MICWLKGKKIDAWSTGSKSGAVVSCGGIGYEVQLLPRDQAKNKELEEITLWIHQIFREDSFYLFGFIDKKERNLFRKLIKINGIGPQSAISLLDKYIFNELVEAIRNSDISKLTKASGIGKKIAERLTIELRDKLDEFNQSSSQKTRLLASSMPNDEAKDADIKNELISILAGLNYEEFEIIQAINAVSTEIQQANTASKLEVETQKADTKDLYLKRALVWLSQDVSSKGT